MNHFRMQSQAFLSILLLLSATALRADQQTALSSEQEVKAVSAAAHAKVILLKNNYAALLQELNWILATYKSVPNAQALKELLKLIEVEFAQSQLSETIVSIVLHCYQSTKLIELNLQDGSSIITNKPYLNNYGEAALESMIQETEESIANIRKIIPTLRLSTLNTISRSLHNVAIKTLHLDKIAQRVFPYAAFGGYLYLVNKLLAITPVQESKDKVRQTYLEALNALKVPAELQAGCATLTAEALKFSPLAYLAKNHITPDLKALKTATELLWEDLRPSILGTPFRDLYPYAKTAIRAKDLPGNPRAQTLLPLFAHQFVNQDQAKVDGAPLAKACLFVASSLYEGRLWAYALAGEITAELKAQPYPEEFLVFEMHGAGLLQKSLQDKMKEVEAYGVPAMIIINEIDWMFNQDDIEVEEVAKLVSHIGKMAEASSHKRIYLCATATSTDKLDSALFYPRRFAYTLKIETANFEQRLATLQKFAAKRSLVLAPELLTTVAERTEGYALQLLDDLVRHAYALAQFQREPLAAHHFEPFYLSDLYAKS